MFIRLQARSSAACRRRAGSRARWPTATPRSSSAGVPAEERQVELVGERRVIGQTAFQVRDRPRLVGQLRVQPRRVEQEEHLADARLGDPFALAGRRPDGPAEEPEEVVGYLAVPELSRPGCPPARRRTSRARRWPGRPCRGTPRPRRDAAAPASGSARHRGSSRLAVRRRWYVAEPVMARINARASKPPSTRSTRQGVEQLGVRRRVRASHVVHRLDQPPAQEVGPVAIGQVAREVRVVGGDEPVGQCSSGIFPGRDRSLAPAEWSR